MKVKDALYTNTDEACQEVCDFLDALSTQDPCMHWESGRMHSWRYDGQANKALDDPFFQENAHLWRAESGEIVALFISEYGENDFFVEVQPAYREIMPEIFRWIEEHWAHTRTSIEIDVFSDDAVKLRFLEAQGFRFKCHFENKRLYDLESIVLDYKLEEGFTIQAFSESSDYASRVALVRSAFNNPGYTEENFRGLMAQPGYIDAYNLVVVSPAGQHVAYCVGWHDSAKEHTGYIEPVGTHAEYRRRGFASAVIKECFRRMKANGIKTGEIASRAEPNVSNFLYDSLGPKSKREVHKYAKQVETCNP